MSLHRHTCACGDWYPCALNHDHCEPDYTCPSCLWAQQDDYWRQEVAAKFMRAFDNDVIDAIGDRAKELIRADHRKG